MPRPNSLTSHSNPASYYGSLPITSEDIITTNYTSTGKEKASIYVEANDKILEEEAASAATAGLNLRFVRLLEEQSKQNACTISEYLLAMNSEINPSVSYKESQLKTLCYLSDFQNQKPFSKMTRNDVLQYLDSHRRTEESDPLHKWIGTYNLRRTYLLRFFK
jgi:hypothetical protein